ncbi:hypothetical protein TRVL_06508 [Trypanosoma vivax]|uniref:Uncharacterized protein n=1 Tax=Trypanosoma vivax (strain Y486) TaxID=1055687 RepID=G0U5Z9_TRYVY|nr:hypothetical protein TRVL_06508 [Trypanosoma vivax]CCC51300.1 hypothetical protein TVY486_1003530 [Trypanosoma vivax Y486]
MPVECLFVCSHGTCEEAAPPCTPVTARRMRAVLRRCPLLYLPTPRQCITGERNNWKRNPVSNEDNYSNASKIGSAVARLRQLVCFAHQRNASFRNYTVIQHTKRSTVV